MPFTCDAETGVCALGGETGPSLVDAPSPAVTLYYVGDPMCSWCWGIAPVSAGLAEAASANGWTFRLVVGGLRPGGGDEWTPAFRRFLDEEWAQVSRATGQPFSRHLLARPSYEYDSEPACRAIVAARRLLQGNDARSGILPFFSAVQRKFYVDGADPKDGDFYPEICERVGIDPHSFERLRTSAEIAALTRTEFQFARRLGCRAFPSFFGSANGRTRELGIGKVDARTVLDRLDDLAGRRGAGRERSSG